MLKIEQPFAHASIKVLGKPSLAAVWIRIQDCSNIFLSSPPVNWSRITWHTNVHQRPISLSQFLVVQTVLRLSCSNKMYTWKLLCQLKKCLELFPPIPSTDIAYSRRDTFFLRIRYIYGRWQKHWHFFQPIFLGLPQSGEIWLDNRQHLHFGQLGK